ncbi:protein disulfide oxidoreductase [Psychromonas ossibalaenae]|uniref:protein disulfide oxidoreductase n=1 Tax=Psychromonas ossibalaenae TaxID=444922 RepID=UPI000370A9D1|nr:protein disulfide oxidoreductase [Psychromonas ossibalaenae]
MDKQISDLVKKHKGWRGWLKEALVLVLLLTVISWAVDFWRSGSMASGQAPALTAVSVQGEKIDLGAMSQDKPVLLYFWATWCPVCSYVSPSVDFLSADYQVVTVALTSGEEERVHKYQQAKEYDFSTINDPKGQISQAWGISVTPTIFIIDKGQIKSVTTGFTSPMGLWMRLKLT